MDRQILVPLDGSALAEAVLPHAATLARATGSTLALLHALPSVAAFERFMWPNSAGVPAPPHPKLARSAESQWTEAYLEEQAAHLRAGGLCVTTQVAEGDPARAILTYADTHPGTVQIAMATHGRGGLDRWLLGSVAEKVLHAAPTPLLLVRGAQGGRSLRAAGTYHKILVPLDGSTFAEGALGEAAALAATVGATLLLVAVLPEADHVSMAEAGIMPFWVLEARQQEVDRVQHSLGLAAEELCGYGLDVETRVRYGRPAEEILAAAAEEQADLIVMATHGHGGLQHVWLGSVALKLVRTATLPIYLLGPGHAVASWERRPVAAVQHG